MPYHLPPLRREARVATTPVVAFEWFTTRIGTWWPRVLTAFGGSLGFVEGQLEEHSADEVHVWGEVITWNAPHSLRMAWRQPAHDEEQRTNVDVMFVPDGPSGAIVRIVQSGWNRIPDPASSSRLYGGDRGWREVLTAYTTAVAGGLAIQRPDM
ncbi:MAG: SRPBCC domain-containing protein [Deltaproteobacteria bacterium]|nr:SRPBCC domain-containing protein [Deltaproteobacteria bacterium]